MGYITQRDRDLFENFFVLELANNHWGKLDRGLKIIRDHAAIVRYNNVKAAIKLQFRDVDEFIHPEFKGNTENRYIKKTEDTTLSRADFDFELACFPKVFLPTQLLLLLAMILFLCLLHVHVRVIICVL